MRACLPRLRKAPLQPERSCPRLLVLLAVAGLFAGCASVPAPSGMSAPAAAVTSGSVIARLAGSQVGKPYRYGGDGPGGFDCSGLVHYVHEQSGHSLPRSAAAQLASAMPVERTALQPGDLVFFRFGRGPAVDHVGVYLGDGRFVHASKAGAPVAVVDLDAPWFARRYVAAGRYWR